ncbi:methyltransferase domain-containing protein [bacterium]|nr:methyltransferase domain-containing protein [bacterium]
MNNNCNIDMARSLFDFDLTTIPNYAQEYGLLFPKNIDVAIDTLLKASYFDSTWDESSLRDLVCYYLFYPSIVAQQYEFDAYGFYPFCHLVESLHKMNIGKYGDNLQILHAGCGCEETALCGYEAVEKIFDVNHISLFKTIDLCSIPIKRIMKLMELHPFAQGPNFQVEVKSIQRETSDHKNSYDVIITDHLLGSSPRPEYDLEVLQNFYNLLGNGGVIITTIAADTTTIWQPQQHPGDASFNYFCKRHGKRVDGRDSKMGLTKDQWNELGRKYDIIMSNTYFADEERPGWRFRNAEDIQKLFAKAGFCRLEFIRVILRENKYEHLCIDNIDLNQMEGLFVVCAFK